MTIVEATLGVGFSRLMTAATRVAVLSVVISAGGCAAIATTFVEGSFEDTGSGAKTLPRVFSGTLLNVGMLTGFYRGGYPALVIDTPFSLVADVVLLPYTIPMQILKGNHRR